MKLEKIWYGQLAFLGIILLPFSFLYWLVSVIYRYWQLNKKKHFPIPIVIIGGLTTGGVGKTPLLIYLVQQLKALGYKPGIISRGYKSKIKQTPHLVKVDDNPQDTGDEALLISRKTYCPVVIDTNRSTAVEYLLSHSEQNIDIILSDDGLQHYTIEHDIEIILLDAECMFGNGYLLPAGPLRERRGRLRNVDFIVLNGKPKKSSFEKLSIYLAHANNVEKILVYRMSMQPTVIVNCVSHEQLTLDDFRGKTVHACAGIARPHRFFRCLQAAGLYIHEHSFVDHHVYQADDIEFGDDLPVLITEKDAVKCERFNNKKLWTVQTQVKLDDNLINALLEKLQYSKSLMSR